MQTETNVGKKRLGIWILLGLVVLAVLSIFLDPTQVVLGKLMGDAFFQSRPTRYWVRALRAGPASQADAQSRLEQGGTAAVPVLVGILQNHSAPGEADLRWTAAEALGKLGPDAEAAGPALVRALKDGDPHVQAVCITALPKVGVDAEIAVPLLTESLKSDHRVVAARALSTYRAEAAPSLPSLVELLQDSSQAADARWNAARTIGKIGPEANSAVPVLISMLNDKEWTIREHCAEAIGDIGWIVGPEAIAALIKTLSDPIPRVRRDAVRSLGYIGPTAQVALPDIKKLVDDPEELVRVAARDTLKLIAPGETVPPKEAEEAVKAPK